MNVVPFQEPRRPATTAASLAPVTEDPKQQGVGEPKKPEEKHEEHTIDEPGYGHGV